MISIARRRELKNCRVYLVKNLNRGEVMIGVEGEGERRLSQAVHDFGIAEQYFEEFCFAIEGGADWHSLELIPGQQEAG